MSGKELFDHVLKTNAYKRGFGDGKAGREPRTIYIINPNTADEYRAGHRDGTLARIGDR